MKQDLKVRFTESVRRRVRRWTRFGPTPTRLAVQVGFVLLCVAIGWRFAGFVRHFETFGLTPYVERPAGVEGFLPISALMSAKYWVATGVVHPVHPAGFVLFAAFVAMSFVIKKSFCSWACPVGFLSETLGRVGQKLFGKRLAAPRWLDVPLRGIKYLLLAFFAWAIAGMSTAALGQFLDSPYNKLADVKMLRFFTGMSAFAAGVVLVLAALSLVFRNPWCRWLCPYGALLGLVSLASPWKVTRHASACTDCGLCSRVCPQGLPVAGLNRVRSDECTGCLECVSVCPRKGALSFELPRIAPAPVRRLSPARAAIVVVALFLVPVATARVAGLWRSSVSDREYQFRIPEVDSPLYRHAHGSAPRDPRDLSALPSDGRGSR